MQKNSIVIPETFPVFSAEDFLYGTKPYEFLSEFDNNPFKKAQMVAIPTTSGTGSDRRKKFCFVVQRISEADERSVQYRADKLHKL